MLLIACDLIFVSKGLVARARQRIAAHGVVPAEHILISATHTHSGPVTVDCVSNAADPVVPKADPAYLAKLEETLIETALQACAAAEPAEIALVLADGSGVGTNRRDPAGPRDPQVPVWLLRTGAGRPLAAMLICSMHPTVLHEDSTLLSGDFPAAARVHIQKHVLHVECPVLYFTGPAGNQSPRHVTQSNTFAEVQRIGATLGRAVEVAAGAAEYHSTLQLACFHTTIDLPRRDMPTLAWAQARRDQAVRRLAQLRAAGASRQDVRTAECDGFGAEETLALVYAAQDGRLAAAAAAVLPAEIQILQLGPWHLVAWPGELFVEYALEIKGRVPGAFVISLANGELQGYIATPEAAAEGGYEASNALFATAGGALLVERTLELLSRARP
jgi:hypothetical protein